MPILTATSGGVDIPDGSYNATVLSIEEAEPTPNSKSDKPWLRWRFVVDDGTSEGVEMLGASSTRFGPKSKGRLWAEALLGRKMETGEQFDPDKVLPRDCVVVIQRDEQDFARILHVLPVPRAKTPRPTLKPKHAPEPETDEDAGADEDGVSV
jgi:hypothetical protein